MTVYEKEILQAIVMLEKQISTELLNAHKRALREIQLAIKTLALSETMEKLWVKVPEGMNPACYSVYQRQYEREIGHALKDPFEQLEETEKEIIKDGIYNYYLLGTISALYCLHKQNIPALIPAQRKNNAMFHADINKYIHKNVSLYKEQTISYIQRLISVGTTYNQIAKSIDNDISSHYNTPTRKSYNKALTIVRTEGGKLMGKAQYAVMLETKRLGANVKKQWCSVLDAHTRLSHAAANNEIKEIEEPFSNGLLYPCQSGKAPEEVINCRCTMFVKVTYKLNDSDFSTLKESSVYFGFDKASDFEQFKEKYFEYCLK